MKFAVSSYSFLQLIQQGEMSETDCISKAKDLGFDGIEFAELPGHTPDDRISFAETLAETSQRHQLPITNYAFGADFINGCGGDTEQELARVKSQIDIASMMGAPSVRHDVLYELEHFSSFDEALPFLADCCRIITEYAEQKGIRTMVENHGYICQDSQRMEALVHAVNHPNFSLLTDIGNFLCADEDPLSAVERTAPYTAYIHAKDFFFVPKGAGCSSEGFFPSRGGNLLCGTIIGRGCVPVNACLNVFRQRDYDGYISVEFEGKEPALEGIAGGLAFLRKFC